MPVPKKKAATRARRASGSAADDARDAVIAEHMARTQLALAQQAEALTLLVLSVRSLTELTVKLSSQIAALKCKKQGARRPR